MAVVIGRYTFRYKPLYETFLMNVKSKGKGMWSSGLIKHRALKAYSGLKVCFRTFLRCGPFTPWNEPLAP